MSKEKSYFSEAQDQAWGNTVTVEWEEKAQPNPIQLNTLEQMYLLQPHRFQGQIYDVETGLHYNRFRYYDPDCGRFISHDPIKLNENNNHYQYSLNPLQYVDVFGLSPLCIVCNDGSKGRSNKQARLKALINDPKVPKHVKGWIKNELRHIASGNRKTIRLPGNSRKSRSGGYELAHERNKEAKNGFCYLHSKLQTAVLHKLQDKIGGY